MIALLRPLMAATALALFAAPGALADTSSSSNWSGYAVHRLGVRFTRVMASWKRPSATCSTPLSLRVRPGDTVAASVTVVGHEVTLRLADLTTGRSFRRTLRPPSVDVSSAEWIVEAPSDCVGPGACQTLPLIDFAAPRFTGARAQSTRGHVGTISDRAWSSTRIRLAPSRPLLLVRGSSGPASGVASPLALSAAGSSFKVSFATLSAQGNPFLAQRRGAARSGYLVHPG